MEKLKTGSKEWLVSLRNVVISECPELVECILIMWLPISRENNLNVIYRGLIVENNDEEFILYVRKMCNKRASIL